VLMENRDIKRLRQNATFEDWEVIDKDHTVVRFVTSWATREEDVEKLVSLL
jgi:threonine aldolase